MSCRVLVNENSHYQDLQSRWELGTFETADAAISACLRMIDEDLLEHHEPGTSAGDLFTAYKALGDDPFIVPVDVRSTLQPSPSHPCRSSLLGRADEVVE